MSHVAIWSIEQPKAQSNVGALDGCGVGASDGSTVGARVGAAVGNPVGVLVGACVGGEIGHAASVIAAVREARLAYSAERKLFPFDCTAIFFARPWR
jgi:outer membrane lipoprotein SlyB